MFIKGGTLISGGTHNSQMSLNPKMISVINASTSTDEGVNVSVTHVLLRWIDLVGHPRWYGVELVITVLPH